MYGIIFKIPTLLFNSVRKIIIESELLCLSDPFLLLDLYMLLHILSRNLAIYIIKKDLIGKFRFKSLVKGELRIPLPEVTHQLKGMDKGMILDSRLQHDLIPETLLSLIPSARRGE